MVDVAEQTGGFLSDDEVKKLILAAIDYDGVATDEQINKVVEWGEHVRTDAALLSLVLDGKVVLIPDEDEPGEMRFRAKAALAGGETR